MTNLPPIPEATTDSRPAEIPRELRFPEGAIQKHRLRKIQKAGSVAMFNGVTMLIFAVLSGLYGVASAVLGQFDWVSIVISAGLLLLGINEIRARKLMLRFDLRGPVRLGWNQLGLLALISAYCVWMILWAVREPTMISDYIAESPELSKLVTDLQEIRGMDNMVQQGIILIYAAVIGATLLFQGGNAIYYFTRGRLLRIYIKEAPSYSHNSGPRF
jgi:hypothetical protein